VYKNTVCNTLIKLFQLKTKVVDQDFDIVDPDIEIFLNRKENAGWAEYFCNEMVNVYITKQGDPQSNLIDSVGA
jgi:hypothetical protein